MVPYNSNRALDRNLVAVVSFHINYIYFDQTSPPHTWALLNKIQQILPLLENF